MLLIWLAGASFMRLSGRDARGRVGHVDALVSHRPCSGQDNTMLTPKEILDDFSTSSRTFPGLDCSERESTLIAPDISFQ